MKTCKYLTIALAAVFMAGTAAAYVTNVYELESFTADLTYQPTNTDYAQMSGSNYMESGGFYLAAWPACRTYMLFNATGTNDGYNGYGAGAGGGGNIYAAGVLFMDYAVATVRSDFAVPSSIREVRVFAGHGSDGMSSRSFVNCKLEYSTDQVNFDPIIASPTTNMYGTFIGDHITNHSDGTGVAFSNLLTRVYDTTGADLASNVRSLRYTFYVVGWDKEFRPVATAAEGTVAREIDVIGIPEPACALLAVVGLAFLRRR